MKRNLLVTLILLIYFALIIPFMWHYYNDSIFWREMYLLSGNPSQYDLYSRFVWNTVLVFCVVTMIYQSIILLILSIIKQYRIKGYLLITLAVAIILSVMMIYTSIRISAFTVAPLISVFVSAFFSLIQYHLFRTRTRLECIG